MTDDDLRGIAISPRERLERIEGVLERIEQKMDMRFDAMEQRVRVLELRVVPTTETVAVEIKRLDAQHTALEARLRKVEEVGSNAARHAEAAAARAEDGIGDVRRRLAYYAGALAALSVVVNLVLPSLLDHL